MYAEHGTPVAVAKRPRLDMAQIFRARGEVFRRSHFLNPQQTKAMRSIERCRTEKLGGHVDACTSCEYAAISYNSCRNRHCPKCQSLSQAKWIEERKERILPCPYFHVVFTLPAALRPLARRAPVAIYDLLFEAASKTLQELGRNPKRLGAQIGFTAVLHTWTRKLELHPHVHTIVTGGGLSPDGKRWIPLKGDGDYLFPVKVLSALFRGKFLAGLVRLFEAGELGDDPRDELTRSVFDALRDRLYKQDWVVYAKQPFKGAEHVYRYLGRYTHRVGISNQRLEEITEKTVTFATKNGQKETLEHDEFLRRFLLHVLPPSFVKISHYGLLASSNATTKLEVARGLLETGGARPVEKSPSDESWQDRVERLTGEDPRECPRCKGRVVRYDLHSPLAADHVAAAQRGKAPET